MKPIRLILAVLAVAGLTGCYTSDKPLVSVDEAVAPYAKITFQGTGADDKPAAFTRDGKTYVSTGDDGAKVALLLKPIEGDFYIAQLTGENADGSDHQILYAYIRLDVPNKVADTYRAYGTKADERPGLRACKDVICIDDLAAYLAYAKEQVAAGGKPDVSFSVTVE